MIGQGTWNIDSAQRDTAIAALRRGLDLGMTHIDTAQMYGGAEEIVGKAIAGRRNEVFVVSKVLPQNASRRGAIVACERSLTRLGTDRLDVYLLHWPGPHPLEDTFAAFEQLRGEGKIGAWGVSNFDVPDLESAWKFAGPGRIACKRPDDAAENAGAGDRRLTEDERARIDAAFPRGRRRELPVP